MIIENLKSSGAFFNHLRNIDFHVYLGTSTEMHRHLDYYEVLYINKGIADYTINNKKITLNKGDLTFVRLKDIHKFNNSKNDEVQHVNFAVKVDMYRTLLNLIDPLLFNKLEDLDTPPVIKLTDFEFKEVEYWKRKINTAKNSNPNEMFSSTVTALFIIMSIINNKTSYLNNTLPKWFNELLEKVNSSEFINNNVTDLYNCCAYSPPIIIKAFKKYLNKTPNQYLTELKINYACNLLTNTDLTVLYICTKIGYDSLSHFNRIFKKLKNKTPSEYRTQNRL